MYQNSTTIEFLNTLRNINAQLKIQGDSLLCKVPKSLASEELKTEIRRRKNEIIELWQELQDSSRTDEIFPAIRQDFIPLSYTQKRLWVLDKLEPESSAYNMSQAIKLDGQLNVEALQRSLNEIVKRHESLRTTFQVAQNGEPTQVIKEFAEIDLTKIDLRDSDLETKNEKIHDTITKEALKLFALDKGPLFRFVVIQSYETEHILIASFHHIIFDAWSFSIFYKELSLIYTAIANNQAIPLEPLVIQYADFAIWQQGMREENNQAQINYWKSHLSKASHILELPTDYQRPVLQEHKGASVHQRLDSALKAQLKSIGIQANSTLFMVLLSAFKVLCFRFTHQSNITLGSPIAGRNQAKIEELIGFFVSNLVLSTDVSGRLTFSEYLSQVREVTLSAFKNQDVPFEKILEEIKPERDLSRTPIFQVWFNMLNVDEWNGTFSDLKIEFFPIEIVESKFDLTLYLKEDKDGISIQWVYNKSLFEEETIELLKDSFQILLQNVAGNPDQKISTIPLLSPKSIENFSNRKAQQSHQFNFSEGSAINLEQSIPEQFANIVEQFPNNIAIQTQKHVWTYKQLDLKTNQIANFLIETQGNKQERIALLFEHDAPMIAGLLGVLKSGKTYVPLDPKYPTERLLYVLQDSGSEVILTNHQNLEFAQKLSSAGILIINVDLIPESISTNKPSLVISPETIAYILHTSGSTGRPKGVMQNHRNVLHFIKNQVNQLSLNPTDRISLLASYSFDAAIVDIFCALLNGATLYPFDVKSSSISDFISLIENQKITIYHSTPTFYRSFLKSLDILMSGVDDAVEKLKSIRAVVMGGEETTSNDIQLYREFFAPDCIYVNLYGSTESTISMQQFICQQTDKKRRFVSIGYPIMNTEVILLDDDAQETQVYGEVTVRSEHLALGYWQNQSLSDNVFLTDKSNPKYRFYRTGDLGRLRADGTIEYLGRKDFQVKVRGFRVELGEIESTIAKYSQVSKVVVVCRDNQAKEKEIVAYIIPKVDQEIDLDNLRNFIKSYLPDYMIPSLFGLLEQFPLTPSGKINRRALVALNTSEFLRMDKQEFIAPSSSTELVIANIWSKALKLERISIHDNFFDLGGNSLIAVQVFAEMEKVLNSKIPLSILFQHPTIKEISEFVTLEEKQSKDFSSLVALQPLGQKIPIFCTHAIGTSVQFYRSLVEYLGKDQPFYGLQSRFLQQSQENEQLTLKDMARFYIEDIKKVQPKGPYLLGGFSFGGIVAYEMAQQLRQSGETVALLAIFDTKGPGGRRRLDYQEQLLKHWSNFRNFGLDYAKKKITNQVRFRARNTVNNLKQYMDKMRGLDKIDVSDETLNKKEIKAYFELRLKRIEELHLRTLNDYSFEPYADELTLFRCLDQSDNVGDAQDKKLGWGQLIQENNLRIINISGSHHQIFDEPHVQSLAKKMSICLEEINDAIN